MAPARRKKMLATAVSLPVITRSSLRMAPLRMLAIITPSAHAPNMGEPSNTVATPAINASVPMSDTMMRPSFQLSRCKRSRMAMAHTPATNNVMMKPSEPHPRLSAMVPSESTDVLRETIP